MAAISTLFRHRTAAVEAEPRPSSRAISAHARSNAAIYAFAIGIVGTIVSIDFVMSMVGLTIGNHDLPPLIMAILFAPVVLLSSGVGAGVVGLRSDKRPLAILGLVANSLALVLVPTFFATGALLAQ